MAKTNAEKQKAYCEKLKEKNSAEYLIKDRDRKHNEVDSNKKDKLRYNNILKKERERKAEKKLHQCNIYQLLHQHQNSLHKP